MCVFLNCRPRLSSLLPLQSSTNATRHPTESSTIAKPLVGSPKGISQAMVGPPVALKMEGKGAPRNSSIDSAISAISSRTHSHKDSQDSAVGLQDVSHLIKTAGSAEAVIQYLLREKQSQNTQNAQLWRLVDKQRAMILGLNKDLERTLKDKERYRKKLKEFITAQNAATSSQSSHRDVPGIAHVDVDAPKRQDVAAPRSPNVDLEVPKESPIDANAMAPYPITPPAGQITTAPPSAVGELLDPSHSMPKAAEHAFNKFDHEQEEREAAKEEEEQKQAMNKDLPFSLSLPPSRSLPSEPPRVPPPNPPTVVHDGSPKVDGMAQFPSPPVAPPRKLVPAPLQLTKPKPETEEEDSESDLESLLEVTDLQTEKRGRRRTREEDDHARAVIAQKEAEARSLSKKSNNSKKGTPIAQEVAASPRPASQADESDTVVVSLDGVLNGNIRTQIANIPTNISAPAPGLPASPRPAGLSPMHSPSSFPRGTNLLPAPLSPRPPRGPILLPPSSPLSTPSTAKEGSGFTSPKPLNIATSTSIPTIVTPMDSPSLRVVPTERTMIYKGLVTEEYPDLLLPPNALPSIDVRVASSRMKPSRASMLFLTQVEEDPVFTLAVFSRSDRSELWRVEKDSASLLRLDQKLKYRFPSFSAKVPDRSLFSGHSPAKLDARRIALEQYLAELLDCPLDTTAALDFCQYLSTNTLPPNSDEVLPVESGRESATQKTGPGGRPLRSGYLTKRGKNFGGWKARFFVLDGPLLKYYEAPGGVHLGTVRLQHAQIGKQSQPADSNSSPARVGDDDNQYRHAFLILEAKKKDSSGYIKHVLCAESDKERDQWVDALLQWIDYRDPEGEDRPRKGSQSQEQDKSAAKKKRPEKGRQASDSSDALIGMSYDSVKQGELPTREGAARPKPSGPDALGETMHSQAYTISAPRDPQVISDAGNWGNKSSLAPFTDEKRARKRSFFSFGPKARTSSDAHDHLFDGSPAAGPTVPTEPRGGAPRQVFGAPLAEAVRYNSPVDVRVPLPAVVFRCIEYLDAKGALDEEGIFRLSGSSLVIKQLKERFNTEGDVNLINDEAYYDIHAVASLLKLYLRELPTTILTRDLHVQFLTVTEMRVHSEKVAALAELVTKLPQANSTLLKYLIAFLIKIINNSARNKMTVRNVGIVFSPTLNIPAPVFAMFLQNYEGIFGIDAEEYELPSPISESDSQSLAGASRDRHPQQPSTTVGSSSPHQLRFMEAVVERHMGESRSGTPTPSPAFNMAPSRSSPTPMGMRSHEGGHMSQQSRTVTRPAYEAGLTVPSGGDSSPLPSPGLPGRANTGYDRPMYEQKFVGANPPHNQGFVTAQGNRRESSILMGGIMGLQPQGSKSRLREETRL